MIAPRTDVLFGYYGTAPGQIAATFDHVSLCWVGPWGGFNAQVGFLQECASRGLPAIVDLSYLLFADRKYVGTDKAKANLREYFAQLAALGLINQIKALYPIDEPDLNADDPGVVVSANRDIRAVVSEFGISPALAVIYSDHRLFPGIASFDIIGVDSYPHGPQTDIPLLPHQKLMLVPGGANPYRESPDAFIAAAADPRVWGIVAFLYMDYVDPNGVPQLGLGLNGMLPIYQAAGCRITRKC